MRITRQQYHPVGNCYVTNTSLDPHQKSATYESISNKIYSAGLSVESITDALDNGFDKVIKPV